MKYKNITSLMWKAVSLLFFFLRKKYNFFFYFFFRNVGRRCDTPLFWTQTSTMQKSYMWGGWSRSQKLLSQYLCQTRASLWQHNLWEIHFWRWRWKQEAGLYPETQMHSHKVRSTTISRLEYLIFSHFYQWYILSDKW